MDFSYQRSATTSSGSRPRTATGCPSRIEPERARISRMRAEDRAEAARAFQEALLPKLLILQDETGR